MRRLEELTFAAAKSLKRDELRRREREALVGLLPELETVEAERLDGRSVPGRDERIFARDFDQAIRALPEQERDAFILTELRGLGQPEAAAVLGVSQPTVSRRAEAGRAAIREELA